MRSAAAELSRAIPRPRTVVRRRPNALAGIVACRWWAEDARRLTLAELRATMRPMNRQPVPEARIDRMLRMEPVVWLSTVRPDGGPHLVPIWFSWDGDAILVASKPHAQKVRNLRNNPAVMLALGEAEDDFDVGLLHGRAELLDEPAARVLPAAHLAKYREQMAAIGLTPAEFLATYSQVIRIVPTRFLPWHGRTARREPAAGGGLRRAVERLLRPIRGVVGAPAPVAG